MTASINIFPWFLRFIVNFRFVVMAIINSRADASRSLKAIMVTGSISVRTRLVATKEVPQNTTANSMSRYLNINDFELYNNNGGLYFIN